MLLTSNAPVIYSPLAFNTGGRLEVYLPAILLTLIYTAEGRVLLFTEETKDDHDWQRTAFNAHQNCALYFLYTMMLSSVRFHWHLVRAVLVAL